MICKAREVLASNLHTYPGGAIELVATKVHMDGDTWKLSAHDEARWVGTGELPSLGLAPTNIPIAEAVCALLANNMIRAE